LVVAVAGIVFVLGSRPDVIVPSVAPSVSERTPAFAFVVGRSGVLPTAAIRVRRPVRTDPMLRLHGPSKVAARRVTASITRLYRAGFLDPSNWRAGAYDGVWEDFAGAARVQARNDVRILTAGAAAGEAYLTIVPRRSTISTTVLLDRQGKPAVVLAEARFRALGQRAVGPSDTRFDSSGRFFLERIGGSWKIVSYEVRRSDEKVDGGSPSATPAGAG
jgi:hypothetical protein